MTQTPHKKQAVSPSNAKSLPRSQPDAILSTRNLAVIVALIVIMSTAIACGLLVTNVENPKPQGISINLVTGAPDASPTPTPFQPVQPTPTIEFFELPPEGLEDLPEFDIPEHLGESIVANKDVVTILLLGSDQRPDWNHYRTDVIMLVIMNKKDKAVSLVSFPRDLFVNIPGWNTNRINTVIPSGGFGLMADTMEQNFGIRPDFYAMTNFWSFVDTVDNLGGIDVDVPTPLYDKCEPPKTGMCHVPTGMVHMDGETALWYVRSRRTSNDFERTKRGRLVVQVLFNKLMSIDAVLRFPELYNIYKNNVETNIGVQDILPLLPLASRVAAEPNAIKSYGIGPEHVSPYLTEGGAQVLLPNQASINQLLIEAIGNGTP